MTEPAPGSLAEARALRDAARELVKDDIARLKGDLTDQPVGQRITETAKTEAYDLATRSLEVANENKGVIAGTLAALIAWFARKPLMDLANRIPPLRRRKGTAWQISRFFQR